MSAGMENFRLIPPVREGAVRAARPLTLLLFFILSGCLVPGEKGGAPALSVSSRAFAPGGEIPMMYTCDGANITPPLSWGTVPPGTASLAVLVTDPDAPGGTFFHWVAYNIPPGTTEIPAGAPGKTVLPAGSVQGTNDFGHQGYGGPCPPPGRPHRYHFTIYALDTSLSVGGRWDGRMVLGALGGHILARGETVGTYLRG